MRKIYLFALALSGTLYQANAQCSISSAPTNNCSYGDQINAFSLNGVPSTGNSGCGSSGYNSFATPVRTLMIGQTYTWSATVGSGYYSEGVGIWIDLNNDGFYATTEFVASSASAQNHTGSLTIPATATPTSNVRMRVRCAYASNVTSGQACTNGIGFGYGETEDYFVEIICPSTPPSISISGPTAAVCASASVVITATNYPVYSWSGGITNGVSFNAPAASTQYTVSGSYGASCPTISNSAVFNLSVNPTPTISGIFSGSICPGTQYVVTPSGASTYTYTGPTSTVSGASATFSPLSTTTYSVRGTSAQGCVSSAGGNTITVTTLASPTLVLSANPASVCPGVTSTLSASGANTYTWNGSTTGANLAVNPASTSVYTVSGTGTNVCNGVANLTVVVYPTPTVTVNSGTICSGYNFTMNGNGASTYTFTGPTGTVSNIVSPMSTTNYTISGTSVNGCLSNTASAVVSTVNVNASPTIAAMSGTMCMGLTFSVMPTGANSYSINGNSTTSVGLVSPSSNTTYSVTGTGTNGCVSPVAAVANVTVHPNPSVTAVASNTAICVTQASAVLSASGANTYTWVGSGSGSTISVSPASTTIYTVTGTSTLLCNNSATVSVLVNPLPVLSVVPASTFICVGGSVDISVNGANTYAWNTGSSSATISVGPATSTVYNVVGTSTAGCTSTITSAVNVNTITISATPNSSICTGDAITLSGSGATTYTWNTNFPFQSLNITPTASAVYTLNATDANNCSHSRTVSVTLYVLPVVTATPDRTLMCTNESATITAAGASTYSWNNGSSNNSIVVTPTANVLASFTVTGTDNNGCSSKGVAVISVNACVGLFNISAENQIAVYPNPNNGEFVITHTSPVKLWIVNELGQLVKQLELNNQNEMKATIRDLAPGVYFIKDANGKLINQKVIITE